MKTSNISNVSMQNAMRLTILQAQNQLLKSQTEVTTGKFADVGTELGSRTALSLDLTRESARMQGLISTNALATQRLESSQEAMNSIADAGQTMMNALIAVKGSSNSSDLAVATQVISDSLGIYVSAANTSVSGEFIFAGVNSDVRPLVDGDTILADFNAAFTTHFGFAPTDSAQTINITTTQMDDFLTNVVEPMFIGTGNEWTTDWSSASSSPMMTRISQSDTVQTSTSANSDGMRNFALAAVASIGLMSIKLPEDVLNVVSDKVIGYTGKAISGVDSERTQLGLSQERVTKTNASLQIQHDVLQSNFSSMVEVDAYEASTRINNLLALVEASYTLTAKIQKLSLVNYL